MIMAFLNITWFLQKTFMILRNCQEGLGMTTTERFSRFDCSSDPSAAFPKERTKDKARETVSPFGLNPTIYHI